MKFCLVAVVALAAIGLLSGCCTNPGPSCGRLSHWPWDCRITCACPSWGCDPCWDEPVSKSSWSSLWRSAHEPQCPPAPAGYVRLGRRGYVNVCTETIAQQGHPAPPSMSLRLTVTLDPLRNEQEFLKFFEDANRRYPRPTGESMGAAETQEIQNRFGLPDSSYTAIEQWLTSEGMKLVKVDKYYDSRQVCVDATVAEAEKAFATRVFQSADNKMYTNICDPAVPQSPRILAVGGLNNYPTPGRFYPQPPGSGPPCR
jgi:hypothetical protein